MLYEVTGTIQTIGEAKSFGSKGFEKRTFRILTDDDKYPQLLEYECHKDRMATLNGLNEGDHIRIAFSIRGSEWKDRVFTNLVAINVALSEQSDGMDQRPAVEPEDVSQDPEDEDNFPF